MPSFEPIGIYSCSQTYRYEAPRQGIFAGNSGVIRLRPGCGFEEALSDLSGFGRIWILFEFHLNAVWRPKVRPPVSPGGRRIGVFATRSPHRPNRIGLSCVELEKVEGLNVFVRGSDLLDRTPVLDIKPYIPKADSFPDSRTGWLEQVAVQEWTVRPDASALVQMAFIRDLSGLDLENFCRIQLSLDPLSSERKRLCRLENGRHLIACRTWRILFSADEAAHAVEVHGVFSHYSADELLPGAEDKYGDKEVHRLFLKKFGRESGGMEFCGRSVQLGRMHPSHG